MGDEQANRLLTSAPDSTIFAVFAEIDDRIEPLVQLDLSFGRLLEDIVLPYQQEKPFFIDGVSVSRKRLRRLKIVADRGSMQHCFAELHWKMRRTTTGPERTLKPEMYRTRVEAILRECGDDVTSQVIAAYDRTIGQKVADWFSSTDKAKLIETTWQVLLTGIKTLGTAGGGGQASHQ